MAPFDFNSFGSTPSKGTPPATQGTATVKKPLAQGFSFDSFGEPTAPKKKGTLLGFLAKDIQGTATDEDKPEGLGGALADIYQSSIGSKGLSGLAQAPTRPIATQQGAAATEDIGKSRKDLADSADKFISLANTTKDPAQKKKYLSLASQTLKEAEKLRGTAEGINKSTPQSTSNASDIERVAGQGINTALAFSPFAKGTKIASSATTLGKRVVEGAKTGAGYGAGFGAGSSLASEKSPIDVAKETAMGAGVGAVGGAALPVAFAGAKGTANLLKKPFAGRAETAAAEGATQAELLQKGSTDASVATKALNEAGAVVDNPKAQEAVRQGVPKEDVALINQSSRTDKAKMAKMLETRVKGLTDKRYAATNRSTDVVGNTFVENVAKPVERLNKEAGKNLDVVAQRLAGQKIDPSNAVKEFTDALEQKIGVTVDEKGNLNFKGSDFEGLKSVQSSINEIYKRARRLMASGDALQAHRTKSFIDQIVEYGAEGQGLKGKASTLLKQFRHNIDAELDSKFPAYNAANTQFSDTIQLLQQMSEAIGKKSFKLKDTFVDANTGTAMRRIFSNTQSRTKILSMLDQSQKTLQKYGIKSGEDVINQAAFADLLEKEFGTEAGTSMAGAIERGTTQALSGVSDVARGGTGLIRGGLKLGTTLYDLTRGVNQENKVKALKALLEDLQKGTTTFGKRTTADILPKR